jgi:hypothetical protein
MLTLVGGLCCVVGFINPVGVTGVRRHRLAQIYWAQPSMFHLKTETEPVCETSCLNERLDDG